MHLQTCVNVAAIAQPDGNYSRLHAKVRGLKRRRGDQVDATHMRIAWFSRLGDAGGAVLSIGSSAYLTTKLHVHVLADIAARQRVDRPGPPVMGAGTRTGT